MASYEGLQVCRVLGLGNLGEANRWPMKRLSWQVVSDLPSIPRDSFRGAVAEACDRWAAVCGLTFYEGTGSDANLLVTTQREGPGGVLADCQLPYPGIDPRASLKMRVDEADAWALADNPPANRVGLVHVLTHEAGHWLGLGHGPSGCIMQPTYSSRLLRPQSWDIVEARARYGDRATQPSGDAQPTPAAGGRRRFDGRVLRGLLDQFPGLIGVLGAGGIDPAKIPDLLDVPNGLDGLFGADGLEVASLRIGVKGVSLRIMGREIPVGPGVAKQ